MKQSNDPEAFYKKFKFKLTMTQPSEEFPGETLSFEGLEARYVSRLERDVEELKKHASELRERLWFFQEKEYRKPFSELITDKKEKGV